MRSLVIALLAAAAIVPAGCVRGRPPAAAPPRPEPSHSYVDLQPGWRLRVVTPITKSGAYVLKSVQTAENNAHSLDMEMSAPDLIGYEVAYYRVSSGRGGALRIRFDSASVTSSGKTTPSASPRVPLFDHILPQACCIRLLFLTRVSGADHNAAVLSAATSDALNAKTQRIEQTPEASCQDDERGACFWVPAGVAVQPQQRNENGKE